MSLRRRVIAWLLRVYPAHWRHEYGPELSDLLSRRQLDVGIVADVFRNGVWQRVRTLDQSTVVGLGILVTILAGLAWNIIAPRPYDDGWTVLLEPSVKTLPKVHIRPLSSDAYLLLLLGMGGWLCVRHRCRPMTAGAATLRIGLIASLPLVLLAGLMQFGALDIIVAMPGDRLTTFQEHGWAYTYYAATPSPPTPLHIVISALLRLPESWMWGSLGGVLGRGMARWHAAVAAHS